MQFLTVSACFYCVHHDIFSRHERKLTSQTFLDHLRIYYQTIYHVQAQIQDTVDCQEAFRNGKSLVCGVIQRSLKPLGC